GASHAIGPPPLLSGHLRGQGLGLAPQEHRQLPLAAGLVEAQDVDVAVVALDLEVAIVSSRPLVVAFHDFDRAPIKMKASRRPDSAMVGKTFDLYPHANLSQI